MTTENEILLRLETLETMVNENRLIIFSNFVRIEEFELAMGRIHGYLQEILDDKFSTNAMWDRIHAANNIALSLMKTS